LAAAASVALRAALAILVAAVAAGTAQASAPAVEARRIERLIEAVAQLQEAKFVRNGVEHDAAAAANHLRLKWREAGRRVTTAEDFIRFCGSRSSVSGEPYRIRFRDGTVTTSEAFLRDKLKELEARGE
jgi:hypothetical protein